MLPLSAQARWRAVNAPHLVALVRAGARFERGVLVARSDEHAAWPAADGAGQPCPSARSATRARNIKVTDDLFRTAWLLVQAVVAGADGIRVGHLVARDDAGGDRHRCRVNPLGAEFGVQRVRPVAQAGHGQAHVGQEGRGNRGRHTGCQQQCPLASGAHLREHLSHGRHRAQHMQLELRGGGCHRGLCGVGDRPRGAGAVLQDIDRSERLPGPGESIGQRVTISDIGGKSRSGDAQPGQITHQSVQGVPAPSDQSHLEAVPAESPGHAHPQPRAGTDNNERLRHHNIPSDHSGSYSLFATA